MAKEPDQTRWVGIRPTDPAEDIPVEVVRPTGTISDLQAIKAIYYDSLIHYNKDCSVSYNMALPDVPAGEIWVVNNIVMRNADTICDVLIYNHSGGVSRRLNGLYSVEADTINNWNGKVILGDRKSTRLNSSHTRI